MAAAGVFMVTGCSSDKDDSEEPVPTPPTTTEKREWTPANIQPEWHVDWSSNITKPQWTAPDPYKYESWMLVMVKIQDELLPYVSRDDLMSVAINGETRVVASPAQNASLSPAEQSNDRFLLKILGNEDSKDITTFTIRYYNANLKQLFEVTEQDYFVAEKMFGVVEDYYIDFLSSCTKYPIVTYITVILPDDITPVAGDMIAAFAGNECRGVQAIDSEHNNKAITLTVYGREDSEQVTFSYYSQVLGTTTFDTTVKLSSSDNVVKLK